MPQLAYTAKPRIAPRDRKNTPSKTSAAQVKRLGMSPISLAVLADFTGQLRLMLRTGTPVVEALEALGEQTTDARLYDATETIKSELLGGASFAAALERQGRIFDRFYVNTVRAGEATGQLAEVFEQLETHLRKKLEFRNSLIAALIYPAIIGSIAIGAVTFILIFVLPKFVRIFEKAGVVLPAPTRLLMLISHLIVNYWYLGLLGFATISFMWYMFIRTAKGLRLFDYYMLNVTFVGQLNRTIQSAALLRTLGTLLGAGVSLMESLDVARNACRNFHFREFVRKIESDVSQGKSLAMSFRNSPLMSASIKTMVATGDKTGTLAEVLQEIAGQLETQIDRTMKRLGVILEPMIIVVMGVVVGFIAISVLLPLFKLTSVAGSG